ncbi:MAG: hypothetical protein JOY90_23310 [Bradyrhizobium sp.]|uniref:hypothetical protein n=1 Tax=Bradyrhizobium sp. TaxID=376 RepID=UPI001D8DDAC8|nr:hypothetical protein [Bradyrhizobium sp.]MBV9563347.1 hypothetical protein [Bradyrhizobium sp.]
MKLLAGWAVSAGLILAATSAHAQVAGPRAVSDFDGPGPYVEEAPPPPLPPAPVPRPYGYYGPGPGPGYGDERDYAYRRDYGYRDDRYAPPEEGYAQPQYGYGPPLIPVPEVYAVLRDNGFSPLGIPRQRGNLYVVSVIDRNGEDGRLVIDGRNGRIIRFTPASHWGDAYNRMGPSSALVPPRGAAGPLPPIAASQSVPQGTMRPPTVILAPRFANRSAPLPADKPPVAAAPAPAHAPQQSAAVVKKPAEAAAPAATVAAAPQAKPPAPPAGAVQPTQPMPKVQDLE